MEGLPSADSLLSQLSTYLAQPQDAGQQPQFTEIDNSDPLNPTQAQIKAAERQGKAWMKHSAAYVRRKVTAWHLYEDLYWNRRKLDQWNMSRAKAVGMNRKARRDLESKKRNWHSNLTVACSPFCDNYVQNLHEAIFSNTEYFNVKPSPKNQTGNIEDPQYPTSRKIQTKLLQTCDDLQFPTRIEEFLIDGVVFGTAAAKVPWMEEAEYIKGIEGGEVKTKKKVHWHGAGLEVLNLEKFLPDPNAKNGDIKQWSGIGDRAEVPYEVIRARFSTPKSVGPYNLNRSEFLKKWPEQGELLSSAYDTEIKTDKDARAGQANTEQTYLQVWERHGKIFFDDGPKECVITVITGLATDDPSDGILVRLQLRPILSTWRRPYLLWQFTPTAGPFGMGLIEHNLDIVWSLSHAINLFLDAVRVISIPTLGIKEGSPLAEALASNPNAPVFTPGGVLVWRNNPNEVGPLQIAAVDLAPALQLIQYFERILEKRTSVSDATRGVSETRKTATEVTQLAQAGLKPIGIKLKDVAANVLDPYAFIAISYLKDRVLEDQQIWMKGPNGIPTPVTLTAEELQTGEYVVKASLNYQDQTKISTANTIMQVIPVLEQEAQNLLIYENKRFLRAGLIEELVRLLGITEVAKVLEDVDEPTKMMILQMMNPATALPPEQQGQDMGQGPPPQQGQLFPGTEGGPVGPESNQMNELLQAMQYAGMLNAPIPPGAQYGA